MKNKFISAKKYQEILKLLPIPCVDIIVVSDNKFLMGKRSEEPAEGTWFFPGGRIMKGETFEKTAIRKAREEIGLGIKKGSLKLLGVGETVFPEAKIPRHTVNVVFLIKIAGQNKLKLIKEHHSELVWFTKISPMWHPYVKHFLKEAGFK